MNGPARLDDPQAARTAGAPWLSVALMDARNRTLRWLALFESAGLLEGPSGAPIARGPASGSAPNVPSHETPDGALVLPEAWRLIGRSAWFQERWVARHMQRGRGAAGDSAASRLASVEPLADVWFDPLRAGAETAGRSGSLLPADSPPPPSADTIRAYLATTLETTLELLETAKPTDAGLHVFRLALRHEDRLSERLATLAHWRGVAPGPDDALGGPPPARPAAEPLWMPARRFRPGMAPGAPGFVPLPELGGQEEAVPEFEIDAQAVSWARFASFAEDGGYDDRRWWSDEGWAWVQAQGRRAPRGVAQWRGAVVLERFRRLVRVPGGEAAAHLTWHEAQAWCRWAGRRLPTEIEWELAATAAATRGFTWGDVREWVAGRARLWPGAQGQAVAGFEAPAAGLRVLRGASSWTMPRERLPTARCFVAPERDELFCGFRSCAA